MNSKRFYRQWVLFLAVMLLPIAFVIQVVAPKPVHAAELVPRTMQVSSSFVDEIVSHAYTFSTTGSSTISSIGFEYCTNSPVHEVACVPPAGLDVSSFTIDSELGLTGFSVSPATNANTLAITRAAALEAPSTAVFSFGNITNPSTAGEIVYIRISVYDAPDLGGTRVDRGSVVFVTEDPYAVSAFVPPFLVFCVGITVSLDCSSATGSLVSLGELSDVAPTTGTSQFSVSTNDQFGYNLFLNGQTMTSGNNVIPGLATPASSITGTSQFGINLRANSVPSVGSDPDSGLVTSGVPDASYNTPNIFRFIDGDRIAVSSRSTGYNRFTVSYLVNVAEEQPPGVYASTFTYTAIASF